MPALTEPALTEIVDQVLATLDSPAKPLVYTARPLAEGEDVAAYLEAISLGFLACLKEAHAHRGNTRTNVLAVIAAPSGDGEPFMAAHMALGSLRQMIRVAAQEMGPLEPPVVVNGVSVGNPDALPGMMTRLLGKADGYINGEMLSAG